jgi:hypothetical protein
MLTALLILASLAAGGIIGAITMLFYIAKGMFK